LSDVGEHGLHWCATLSQKGRALSLQSASVVQPGAQVPASTSQTPASRRFGRAGAPVVDDDALFGAQRRLARAQAAATVAEAALAAAPAAPPGHLSLLEDAIILRERQVGADALENPPGWLRADVAERVTAHPAGHRALDPRRLAQAYEGVATYAERAGIKGAESLNEILSAPALGEDLARHRDVMVEDLDLGIDAGVDTGVDLGL
jgi:hypothetical protein